MSVTVQPTFGGFAFEDNGVTIEEWTDEPTLRGATVPVPRGDIARAQDGLLGPRQISIRGIIGPDGGGSREQLRTLTDAFGWALRPGYRQLLRDTDRYVTAEVRRLTLGADEGFSWVPFTAEFEAADPYWYATLESEPPAWDEPANGGTHVVANGGSATAAPIFTITVAATGELTLTLTNAANGQAFTLNALPVTSGQELVIDCGAQTVKLAGANRLRYFTGAFPLLHPGSNTLGLSLPGGSLTSISTIWRQRWL